MGFSTFLIHYKMLQEKMGYIVNKQKKKSVILPVVGRQSQTVLCH